MDCAQSPGTSPDSSRTPPAGCSLGAALDAAALQAESGHYQAVVDGLEQALRDCPDAEALTRARALALQAHHLPRLGRLQQSVRCGSEAVALAEPQNGPDAQAALADALSALCFVYAQLLMGRDALACGLRALAAARAIGRQADRLREAWALNRVGVAYASLDQLPQAIDTTRQALEIAQACAADELGFACLNNLSYFWLGLLAEARRTGNASAQQEAQQQAQALSQRAVALARQAGNPFRTAVALSNLVEALLSQGDFASAQPLLEEYEQLAERHGYLALALQAATQRALILKARGDPAGALAGLRAVLERPPQGEELHPKLRRLLIHALYETHKAGGDYREALAYLEQHAELEREVARDTLALQTEVMLIRQEIAQVQQRAEYALLDARRERERATLAEQEQQRLRDLAAALDRAAHEDVLTGLHNRRHAEFALPLLIEGARQAARPACLALLDVDHFKRINDELGHGIGDLVLQSFAQLLRQKMRSADLLARIGGEEFLIVLLGPEPALALEICERLRQSVAGYDWTQLAAGLQVRISIGLACARPDEAAAPLQERADRALYAAKRGGRNRVHLDASLDAAGSGSG